jgi:hypothetical protein
MEGRGGDSGGGCARGERNSLKAVEEKRWVWKRGERYVRKKKLMRLRERFIYTVMASIEPVPVIMATAHQSELMNNYSCCCIMNTIPIDAY